MTSATTNLPGRLKACRGVLVDSNILLDVATNDPNWGQWSARVLAEVAEHANLTINPIVYVEVSIGYTTIEALDAAIPAALYRREPLPWEAAFLAGKCFVQYRRRPRGFQTLTPGALAGEPGTAALVHGALLPR